MLLNSRLLFVQHERYFESLPSYMCEARVVCFLGDNSESARKRVNKTAYQMNSLDIFRECTNTPMNNSVFATLTDGDLFRINLTNF